MTHQGKRLSRLSVVGKFSFFKLKTTIYFAKHAKMFISQVKCRII